MVAAVNMVLERTSHVAVKIFPKMLYKFYSLSLMRIEGKCHSMSSMYTVEIKSINLSVCHASTSFSDGKTYEPEAAEVALCDLSIA